MFYVQVVSKEMAIQEKEKLYIDLKQILARQPGPEVAEQLQIYQQSLKEKTKQMKVKQLRETFIMDRLVFSREANLTMRSITILSFNK